MRTEVNESKFIELLVHAVSALGTGTSGMATKPVRDRLIADGTLSFRQTTDAFGYNHHVFSASRDADLSVFSAVELKPIEDVIGEIVSMSARQVSDLSHEDAGWQLVQVGETIPYASAYLGTDSDLPERLRPALEAVATDLENKVGHRLARSS